MRYDHPRLESSTQWVLNITVPLIMEERYLNEKPKSSSLTLIDLMMLTGERYYPNSEASAATYPALIDSIMVEVNTPSAG